MGWEDGLAVLNRWGGTIKPNFTGWQQQQLQRVSRSVFAAQDYDPFRAAPVRSAAGMFPASSMGSLNPKYQPAGFPEKLQFEPPWSTSANKPPVVRDTRGDFVASLGASFENAIGDGGFLNLGNAIPWGMERMNVLAETVAGDLIGGDENAVSQANDFIGGALTEIAKFVQPVIDFFPNLVRDTQLNQRASVYRSLVTGEGLGPLEAVMSSLLGRVGLNDPYLATQAQLAGSMSAEQRAFLAKSIDLPESVKRGLMANPDSDVGKLFDSAPEGRMMSYRPGLEGAVANMGSALVLYGIEYIATMGAAGWLGAAGAASAVPAIATGTRVLATTARTAGAIQKAYLSAGMGYFGLSTVADAIARTRGDQELVEWFDRVNRSTIISDDPSIQLVTGFTVDPLRAAGLAKRGTVTVARGAYEATVGRVVGSRLTKLYTKDSLIRDVVAKMYGTTREGVDRYVGPGGAYETWEEATDRVVELAWDFLAGTLPQAARDRLNTLVDGAERTRAVLAEYGGRIVDLIEKHPEAVASRLRRDWEYRDAMGPWDPDVAAAIERDYLVAKRMTVEARQRTDAVVGYVDFLNPEGQAILAREIDGLFANGRAATLADLNLLNARFPAIRGLYRDLVAGKAASEAVGRDVFDTVLERATQKYHEAVGANPVRVRTGVDPIIRPNSVRRLDEYADALGTSADTVRAIETQPSSWTTEQLDLVTAFARAKGVLGEAELAGVSREGLWESVSGWVADKVEPWLKRGEQVEAIEADLARIDDRLRELLQRPVRNDRGVTTGVDTRPLPESRAEIAALQAERGRLNNLLADVKEPLTPFTQSARYARIEKLDLAMVERAKAKVRAMEAIEGITAIDDEIGSWNTISNRSPLHMIRRTRDGKWGWAGNSPAMSDSMFAKLRAFLVEYGGPRGAEKARAMAEMGDEELWSLAFQHRDAAQFRRSLTGSQRRVLENNATTWKSTLDEYKGAWGRTLERAGANVADEDFLDYLGHLKDARDDLLNGSPESAVRRSAGASLPEWAVEQARMGERPDLWYDPDAVVAGEAARRQLARALDGGEATFPAVRDIVNGDPLLRAEAERLALDRGIDPDAILSDPTHSEALRSLVPDELEPRVPGVPRAQTDLDQAILSGDPEALATMRDEMAQLRGRIAPPLRNVPVDAAEALVRRPRPSFELGRAVRDAGVDLHDPIDMALWDKHPTGAKVASMILHGDVAHPPRTPRALLTVLGEIENGNAENIGIGVELAAEAQRAARSILGRVASDARRAQFDLGVIGMGGGLNPHSWAEDTFEVIRDLFGKHGEKAGVIVRDDALGLQYGLKARPKSAVVLEMSAVPGLAEELLTGYFKPFNERLFNAQVRQQFNHIFRGHHNQEIAFAARGRFVDSLAKRGIPADLASRIWREWKERAVASRGMAQEKIKGEFRFRPADNALYASERNIPNAELNAIAHSVADDYFKGSGPADLRRIDFAEEFRLSSSFTRRQIAKMPLGDALQSAYGAVVHNKGVTTLYYIFRFGLDLRFHALNALEGPALFLGRSGLRGKSRLIEGDQGLFGMTREAIESFAKDGLHDTGYPFSHSRAAWAYKTFLREQPDALRALAAEDPRLMQEAIEALARYDPELSATIRAMGDTPDTYLKLLDRHYRKIMESADPEAVVSREIMREAVGDPALAEVYGRLAEVNAQLWNDVRATFFGNPARSQVERALNHYLLYWPISYQIKATKWLARIMFDRAAGLKTNAGGAVALDRMAQYHEQLMAEDPEYREFFDEHPTLLFTAQMLFPMTPGSIGVSLSPLTRDLFFGASKQISAVGPVYTITKLLPDITGELYQDFGQVPGVGDALGFTYRALAGRQPPESD